MNVISKLVPQANPAVMLLLFDLLFFFVLLLEDLGTEPRPTLKNMSSCRNFM